MVASVSPVTIRIGLAVIYINDIRALEKTLQVVVRLAGERTCWNSWLKENHPPDHAPPCVPSSAAPPRPRQRPPYGTPDPLLARDPWRNKRALQKNIGIPSKGADLWEKWKPVSAIISEPPAEPPAVIVDESPADTHSCDTVLQYLAAVTDEIAAPPDSPAENCVTQRTDGFDETSRTTCWADCPIAADTIESGLNDAMIEKPQAEDMRLELPAVSVPADIAIPADFSLPFQPAGTETLESLRKLCLSEPYSPDVTFDVLDNFNNMGEEIFDTEGSAEEAPPPTDYAAATHDTIAVPADAKLDTCIISDCDRPAFSWKADDILKAWGKLNDEGDRVLSSWVKERFLFKTSGASRNLGKLVGALSAKESEAASGYMKHSDPALLDIPFCRIVDNCGLDDDVDDGIVPIPASGTASLQPAGESRIMKLAPLNKRGMTQSRRGKTKQNITRINVSRHLAQ